MNCKMPALKHCFEAAGFADVTTLLSSGNVAFSAPAAAVPELEAQAEAAMAQHWGRSFATIVRPSRFLQTLVAREPFAQWPLPANAKCVVSFLRRPCDAPPVLPIRQGTATIYQLDGTEVFCAYVPGDKGPVFMALLEKTFGKAITTRTWDTVRKCAQA